MSWPADWPEPVATFYEGLALRRSWSVSVREAFASSVEFIRGLAESDRPRSYYLGEEFEGDSYWFETVEHGGELTVIRQMVVAPGPVVQRYWWGRLEDDDGGLTDQALEVDIPEIAPSTQSAFEQVWESV